MVAPWWYGYFLLVVFGGVTLIIGLCFNFFMNGGFDRWCDRFLASVKGKKTTDPILQLILAEDEEE